MKHNRLFLVTSIIVILSTNANTSLFKQFPPLQQAIPHITLCDLPTPIAKLDVFGSAIGCDSLFIKRDDLTGKKINQNSHLYGGNKPRKLEFLLADAQKHNAQTIITYGCAGSNHALATAVYTHELGFNAILMLKNQPNSYVVRHNLMLDNHYGAQLQFYPNNSARDAAADVLLQADSHTYRIPTGGSNAIGTIGFVNATFELAEQIISHAMPEPDLIYVATGSCATAAGLLLGIKAARLKARLVAVCVEPEENKNSFLLHIQKLFKETNEKLHAIDSSFPLFDFPDENLILNKKFMGTTYGLFIPEAMHALKLFKQTENITLEGTYSAKPVAAIMDDAAAGYLQGKTILFWNTYCGIDFSYLFKNDDYKQLPPAFHTYFEHDVQPLAQS